VTASESTELDVPAAIRAMRNARDFDRLRSMGAFDDMSADALEAALDVFARENRKKPGRFFLAAIVLTVALSMLVAVASKFHRIGPPGFAGWVVPASMGWAAVWASTPLQRRLALLISALDDVKVVGPLTDALDNLDPTSIKAVVDALVRLLPRLEPKDAGLLSEKHRRRLGAELVGSRPELAEACLRALVQIGDASCYGRVERLSRGGGLARKRASLRQAAHDALPRLAALKERERQAATLLRPAEAPASATLLRPAGMAPRGDDATLLRPAEGPAEEVDAHG
jgi:hypothetical protein